METRCNYNPNEGNDAYYNKIKEVAEQLLKEKGESNRYLDCEDIPQIITRMGYEILLGACEREDYSGDIYLLYKDTRDNYYLFRSAYGSCCCCDIWGEGALNSDEFCDIFRKEDMNTIKFDSLKDVKAYMEEKKPYFFDDKFNIKLKELLN